MSEALTVIERNKLAELEEGIQRHLDAVTSSFFEAGNLLTQIRDNRLYREYKHEDDTPWTFEEYCKNRWRMTKTHANRLISSAEVTDNLTPIGVNPQSESVVRPLVKLSPDQQREAWLKAIQTAPEGGVTARHVYKIVKEMTEEKKEPEKKKRRVDMYQNIRPKPEKVSVLFMNAFDNMLSAIKNERALKWKETSKEDAEKYVQILLDTIIL